MFFIFGLWLDASPQKNTIGNCTVPEETFLRPSAEISGTEIPRLSTRPHAFGFRAVPRKIEIFFPAGRKSSLLLVSNVRRIRLIILLPAGKPSVEFCKVQREGEAVERVPLALTFQDRGSHEVRREGFSCWCGAAAKTGDASPPSRQGAAFKPVVERRIEAL